ncbi:MAG: anti-sigma factor [Oceanicaulis sp.]
MTAPDRDIPEGEDQLAAEYALGVLEGEARAEAAERVRTDKVFADRVEAWAMRLAPMAETLAPAAPPARVKAAINARLFGEETSSAAPQSRAGGFLESLAFWRGAAAFASLVAVAALSVLVIAPEAADDGARFEAGYFAALRADDASPVVLVRYDAEAGELVISGPVDRDAAQPVQPELWVIPPGEGAAPQSLGLIASVSGDLTERVAIDAETGRRIAQGATLAISLEPPGGSPTGAPTGPVIALGAVQSL